MLFTENKENRLYEQEVLQHRAVIVGVDGYNQMKDLNSSMQELRELCHAAGAQVLGEATQTIKRPEAATYIGSGKVEEIKTLVQATEANLVVFNDELSASQIRNLENAIEVRVVDRTILILDIFALRASSHVSKLQVELAQLKYSMPRLIGRNENLSRTGGGIGTRGPGEQKLEIDRRIISDKILDIKQRLKLAVKNRETGRTRSRKNKIPKVALVGYTNAGKSSVMNRIIEKFASEEQEDRKLVFEKDMLFATLDTSSRRIDMGDNRAFILVDTVGFVDRLPHTIFDAFKATLEDAMDADILLHIVDASSSSLDMQLNITGKVLKELEAIDKPIIRVFNKADLLGEGYEVDERADVYTSMTSGEGLDELIEKICENLYSSLHSVNMKIPYTQGGVLNEIMDASKVNSMEYQEDGTFIQAELDDMLYQKYFDFIVES